jgi:hypothetical protein
VTDSRHDRLRNALRENLKRRKAQAKARDKGRAATTDSAADEALIDPDETAQPAQQADTKRSP